MIKLKEKVSAIAVTSFLAIGCAAPIGAQEIDTSTEFAAYLKALTAGTQSQKNVYAPSVVHATTAPSGTGFIELNLYSPRGGTPGRDADGSMTMGIGFGDVDANVGGSIAINVTGLVPFGTDGDFTLKLAKTIRKSESSKTLVGVQVNRLAGWGANATLATSYDASISHFGTLSSGADATPYIVTLGYGSISGMSGVPSIFAAIGVGLTETLGFGVSVKAGALNAGFGYKVPSVPGMSVSFGVDNINRAGPGTVNAPVINFGIHFAQADLFGRN